MTVPTIEIEVTTIDPLDLPLTSDDLRLMSPADRAKCLSYRSPADRRRFLAGRILIAKTLNRMLGPGAWRLATGVNGRPHAVASCGSSLDFNLAHTSRYAIIVATREGRVGIDMEPLSAFADFEKTVEIYLAPAEAAAFWNAPAAERQRLAAQTWVIKEALLKAEGSGLMRDPRELILAPAAMDGAWRRVDGALCASLPMGSQFGGCLVGVAWIPSSGDLRQPRALRQDAFLT